MLSDTLREGAHGRIFKILFWIIILSFVFAGVGNYLIPRLDTDPVKVGDFKITSSQWSEQYNRQTQQIMRAYGPKASEMLEDKDTVKRLHMQVLESMVDNAALNAATWEQGIRIGDEEVKDEIRRTPAFQKDGKFNNDLFLASVHNIGASPESYAEQVRTGMLSDTVRDPSVALSAQVMPYESEMLGKLFAQTRTVDIYSLDPSALKDTVKVTDEEAKAYYDAHHDEFMDPANVRFTYVVLSVDGLRKSIKISDKEAEDYYNMHQDEFQIPESREVSHILIKNGEGSKDKVAKVQQELKDGKSFADVAKEYSDDPNTAKDGGSMGSVTHGKLASNLDDALFKLEKPGDVSEPIVDDYGTHFIRLDGITAAHTPAFADVKEKARESALSEAARKQYDEKASQLSDVSFENPDSLDATAKALGLEVKDSGVLHYGDKTAQWPLNTEEMQKAAFKEENRTSNVNSPAISLGDSAAAVINVSAYNSAKLLDFDKVKDKAQQAAYDSKASEEARKILEDYASKLKSDPSAAAPQFVTAKSAVVLSRGSQDADPEFAARVFAMPAEPGKATLVARNGKVESLAVLKDIGEGSQEQEKAYTTFISSQFQQYAASRAEEMLFKGARELMKIKYNDDAINMVIKQDSGDAK
ncbi:MAG: SurA N-terminal domain-containing protein [Succinivibrio sp.]